MITSLQEKLIMLYVLDKLGTSLTADTLLEIAWKVNELPPIIAENTIDSLIDDLDVECETLLGVRHLFLTDKGLRHLNLLLEDEIPHGKLRELDDIVKGIINGVSEIYIVENFIEPIDEESYFVHSKLLLNGDENFSFKIKAKDLADSQDFLNYFERNAKKIKDMIVREEDI